MMANPEPAAAAVVAAADPEPVPVANLNFDLKVLAIVLKVAPDIDPRAVQKAAATSAPLQMAHESLMDRAQARRDRIKVAPLVANSAVQAQVQAPLESLMDALLRAARKVVHHVNGLLQADTAHRAAAPVKEAADMNHAHRADVLAKEAADMNPAPLAHGLAKVDTNLAHRAEHRQKADTLSAKNAKVLMKKDQKAAHKRSALTARPALPVKRAVAHVLQVMVAPVKVATANAANVLRESAATMKVVQVQTIQI